MFSGPSLRVTRSNIITRRIVASIAVSAVMLLDSRIGVAQSGPPAPKPIVVRDDNGEIVKLARPARRVVSLIPSAVETLIAIGAADRIVGRTEYDTASIIVRVPSVGGGLEPNFETLLALKPDLVITWSSQKRLGIKPRLHAAGIPVYALNTQDTTDVFHGIPAIGKLVGREKEAAALSASIHADFAYATTRSRGRARPKVLYVVSIDPAITAGPKAFVSQVIGVAGGTPLFNDAVINWPTVSLEEIARRAPDVIILPVGEFRENAVNRMKQAPGWRDLSAVRRGRIVTIHADLVNRPGANLGKVARIIRDSLTVIEKR